jgi:hypothetical protein
MSSIELRDARLARHPTAVEGHTVSRDDGDLAGLAFRRRCQLVDVLDHLPHWVEASALRTRLACVSTSLVNPMMIRRKFEVSSSARPPTATSA